MDLRPALLIERDDQDAVARQAPPGNDGFAIRRNDDVAVEHKAPGPDLCQPARLARRETDDVAVLLHDGARDAVGAAETCLFLHVAHLAVDRDEGFRPEPAIDRFQVRPPRMAGNVNVALPVGDHLYAPFGEQVLHPADGKLVTGNLPAREQHHVAFAETEWMTVFGDAGERGARFALSAGSEDQHLSARQAHRGVEIDHRRKVLQVTVGLCHLDDPLQRAARHAQRAAGFLGDMAERLQPGDVGSERGDEHPAAFPAAHFLEQPLIDHALRAGGRGIEDVGRIAHQGEHALIADFDQFLVRRRLTDERLIVELPVAGMEYAPERRFDQQCVALGDGMRQRNVGNLERTKSKAAVLAVDDVKLDLVLDAGFDQLAPHQIGSERSRVKRHAQLRGEVGDRADMILMGVGQDHADQAVCAFLDEFEIGEDQVDARIFVAAERHAEIDHQPLPAAAVKIDVHADLARSPEREEQQFVFGREILLHAIPARSARIASPSSVRSGSTWSKIPVCLSNSSARPPVATTLAGRPISARMRVTNPSIIET